MNQKPKRFTTKAQRHKEEQKTKNLIYEGKVSDYGFCRGARLL